MRRKSRDKPEPTIALINVVFLMLVFFLVAGTIAQPLDKDLSLVRTADLDPLAPPDALVVAPDGTLSYRGEALDTVSAYLARIRPQEAETLRIVPDRDLPAARLIEIGAELQAGGAQRVMIVTQRGTEGNMP
ncbi:ExbD/TolR family protein [Celeribacter neptunius]|uniref:Biopolymer transport protein ExbD n=1 Tax=Celeribacter neptunius TaxID=588602 RepID=A0A1I3TEP3_9RHOB|nr:biopolymer transporter ExbD [Celeribacter neptunius]SFJ69638.1 biopolymer transport protein ExbD [Celeribacter neptunius]